MSTFLFYTVPATLVDLLIDSVSQSIVSFSWSAGSGNVDEYRLYLTADGSSEALEYTVPANQYTETVDNLSPDTTYTLEIAAAVSSGDLEQVSALASVTFDTGVCKNLCFCPTCFLNNIPFILIFSGRHPSLHV